MINTPYTPEELASIIEDAKKMNPSLAMPAVDDPKTSAPTYGVFPESFGAKGDGVTNDTQAILNAITAAKNLKQPIFFTGGKTYKFIPTKNVDITGIPEFIGYATLDMTGVNTSQVSAIFNIKGTSTALSGTYTIDPDQTSFRVAAGNSSIQPGTLLYVTSEEALDNPNREYYKKGQLFTVRTYNSSTGDVTPYEPIRMSMNAAKVEVATFVPTFTCDKNLTFKAGINAFIYCFNIQKANVDIRGSFYYFGNATIIVGFTIARFEVNVYYPFSSATPGYQYGIIIADLSRVIIANSYILGGRHAVASGGYYPSDYEVNGGYYVSVLGVGALDAHGNVWSMNIYDAIIVGGLNVQSAVGNYANLYISFSNAYGVNISNINNANYTWGDYTFTNCIWRSIGPTKYALVTVEVTTLKRLRFLDCRFDVDYIDNSIKPPFSIISPIKELAFVNTEIEVRTTFANLVCICNIYNNTFIFNAVRVKGVSFRMLGKADNLTLRINDCAFTNAYNQPGLYTADIDFLQLQNCMFLDNQKSGASIANSRHVIANACVAHNNGQILSNTTEAAGLYIINPVSVSVKNCDFQSSNSTGPGIGQAFGVVCTAGQAYILLGNDARGCKGTSGNPSPFIMRGTRLVQLGNVADVEVQDFLNT